MGRNLQRIQCMGLCICLLPLWLIESANAVEMRLADFAVSPDEHNRFVLKVGQTTLLFGDGGQVRRDWESEELMPLVHKGARMSLHQAKHLKRLTLKTQKRGIGSFRREVVLLPDECLVKWDLRLEGDYDQRLGELGVFIPQESVLGKPFRFVDEGWKSPYRAAGCARGWQAGV